MLARVEAAFGGISPGTPARRRTTEEPPQEGERRVHLRKPGTTAYWRAVYHAPRFADPDFFPLLALDAILSGASGLNIWSGGSVPTPQRSARLYRALVNTGLASGIDGSLVPTADPYLYSVSATVAHGQSLAAVEAAVLAELDRLVADGVTAAELTRVLAQLRARFVFDGGSVTDLAHQLGYFATIGQWQDWGDGEHAAGRRDARRRQRGGEEIPRGRQPHHRHLRAHQRRRRRGPLMALVVVRRMLPNGLTVIAARNRLIPAVSLAIGVNAGASADPPGAAGTAALTARVLDKGTSRYDAAAIADELDGRGASLSVGAGRQQIVGERDLPGRRSRRGAARGLRGGAGAELPRTRGRDPPRPNCSRRFTRPPTTPAPWLSMRSTRRSIPAGTRSAGRCVAWRRRRRRWGRPTCAPSTSGPLRRRRRRSWRLATSTPRPWWRPLPRRWPTGAASPRPSSVPGPPPPITTRSLLVRPMLDKSQADVAYGFVGLSRRDDDYYAALVMNNALGQYALGGRLGDSIRERQGMAYYVFSSLDASLAAGPLMVRAGVSGPNVQRTIDSIDQELNTVLTEGFTPAEVDDSKKYLIGSLPRQLETNAGIAGFLLSAELFGLGMDHDVRLPALIAAVTHDDVARVARRLLDPARAIVALPGRGPVTAHDAAPGRSAPSSSTSTSP